MVARAPSTGQQLGLGAPSFGLFNARRAQFRAHRARLLLLGVFQAMFLPSLLFGVHAIL
jgi:hypothetical protein